MTALITTSLLHRPRTVLLAGLAITLLPAILYLLLVFCNAIGFAFAAPMLDQNAYYNTPRLFSDDLSLMRFLKNVCLTICGWDLGCCRASYWVAFCICFGTACLSAGVSVGHIDVLGDRFIRYPLNLG